MIIYRDISHVDLQSTLAMTPSLPFAGTLDADQESIHSIRSVQGNLNHTKNRATIRDSEGNNHDAHPQLGAERETGPPGSWGSAYSHISPGDCAGNSNRNCGLGCRGAGILAHTNQAAAAETNASDWGSSVGVDRRLRPALSGAAGDSSGPAVPDIRVAQHPAARGLAPLQSPSRGSPQPPTPCPHPATAGRAVPEPAQISARPAAATGIGHDPFRADWPHW